MDCMIDSPVGQCHCLPENTDILWLHLAGHYPAEKQLMLLHEKNRNVAEDLIPVPYFCHIAPYNN